MLTSLLIRFVFAPLYERLRGQAYRDRRREEAYDGYNPQYDKYGGR